MSQIDFYTLRSQHRGWIRRLNAFLEGKSTTLTEIEAFSHEDCDLGKWLYSVGMVEYEHIEQMQELEKVHVELHTLVRRISVMKRTKHPAVENKIEELKILDDKILSLLGELQKIIK